MPVLFIPKETRVEDVYYIIGHYLDNRHFLMLDFEEGVAKEVVKEAAKLMKGMK